MNINPVNFGSSNKTNFNKNNKQRNGQPSFGMVKIIGDENVVKELPTKTKRFLYAINEIMNKMNFDTDLLVRKEKNGSLKYLCATLRKCGYIYGDYSQYCNEFVKPQLVNIKNHVTIPIETMGQHIFGGAPKRYWFSGGRPFPSLTNEQTMWIYDAYQKSKNPLEKASIVSAGLEQDLRHQEITDLELLPKNISTYVDKEQLRTAVDKDFEKLQEGMKNLIKDSEKLDDSALVEKLRACCIKGTQNPYKSGRGYWSYNELFDLKRTEEELS